MSTPLHTASARLDDPVHLLAFSDEEGTRFQTTYLGSRSIIAPLDPETLAATNADGVTIAQAISAEGWNADATTLRYAPGECRGYVELHIEQGRVLEDANQPACVVSSIAGQSRLTVTLVGRADHAGTTPMPLRRDALTGAAQCILASDIPGEPFLGNPRALLQTLLPIDPRYDLAMNIFTYQPGATLPFVETHIMEHGLLMLAGQGIHRLEERYYPVTAGDAIWMAPYCPQWFVAMGGEPAGYLYYKDVHRLL